MIKLTPIKVKASATNFAKIEKGVRAALDTAKDGVLDDFEATTQGWEHNVAFTATAERDGYTVGTDDEIYGYVDQGTRPHVIVGAPVLRFQSGYKPKTAPRVIGSGGGGATGGIVYTRRVNHPGTEAREFSQTIAEKWQRELPLLINEALGDIIGGLD